MIDFLDLTIYKGNASIHNNGEIGSPPPILETEVKQIDGQPPILVNLTLKFGETRWPTSETNLDPN